MRSWASTLCTLLLSLAVAGCGTGALFGETGSTPGSDGGERHGGNSGGSRGSDGPVGPRGRLLSGLRIHDHRLAELIAASGRPLRAAPHIAFVEFAYPRTSEEHNAMGGHALVRITALSREAASLPLAKVYLTGLRGEFELIRVAFTSANVKEAEPELSQAVGPYLCDAIYLMPSAVVEAELTLTARFAGSGAELELFAFPLLPSDNPLPAGLPPSARLYPPDSQALKQMLDREFSVSMR